MGVVFGANQVAHPVSVQELDRHTALLPLVDPVTLIDLVLFIPSPLHVTGSHRITVDGVAINQLKNQIADLVKP